MEDDEMQKVIDQTVAHIETSLLAIMKRSFIRFRQFAPNTRQKRRLFIKVADSLCTITDGLLAEKQWSGPKNK